MSADPPVSECRKSGVEQVVSLPDLPSSVSKEEEDVETLLHSEILDIFEEGLAQFVQDPLLCDLPIQVHLEEVNSQIALEYGQAMIVRVLKADGEIMPIVVVQNATVLDLKKASDDKMRLKDYGIRNMEEVTFMKRHMKKVHTGHTPDGQYTQEDVGLSWIPLGPRLKEGGGCDAPVDSSGEGVAVLHPASLIAVTQGTWVWWPAVI
ncbi:uncharacterized protein LOC117551172 [Gymnodraco acuticeps]|uniref:Uncharacterized protein LOC117551172 n=1 Tax=Gymnodraco acuticeps TaxID=8218 RepID=A0A6P8UUJ1_GYMAC|nr:uncharacterized protein LOC117551172 [Gymnodraco acuticeps]